MLAKGKRLKYTEFIILLRIPKGSVDMNSHWLERIEMRVWLLDFNLKFELRISLVFRVSDTFRNEY